jgi:hypothetical protein
MKLANLDGRLALVLADGVADVATASDGRFGPDPMSAFDDWAAFASWAAGVGETTGPLDEARLGCPGSVGGRCFDEDMDTIRTPDKDTATGVLTGLRQTQATINRAEVEKLHLALRWAAIHTTDTLIGPLSDWDEELALGGEGCPAAGWLDAGSRSYDVRWATCGPLQDGWTGSASRGWRAGRE